MFQTIVKINGMACAMCESHINDTIRASFRVKSVKSSHTKGETVILSEEEIPADNLVRAISATGYTVLSADSRPYEKKGFALFKRR